MHYKKLCKSGNCIVYLVSIQNISLFFFFWWGRNAINRKFQKWDERKPKTLVFECTLGHNNVPACISDTLTPNALCWGYYCFSSTFSFTIYFLPVVLLKPRVWDLSASMIDINISFNLWTFLQEEPW